VGRGNVKRRSVSVMGRGDVRTPRGGEKRGKKARKNEEKAKRSKGWRWNPGKKRWKVNNLSIPIHLREMGLEEYLHERGRRGTRTAPKKQGAKKKEGTFWGWNSFYKQVDPSRGGGVNCG